jgi:hypothetical protein
MKPASPKILLLAGLLLAATGLTKTLSVVWDYPYPRTNVLFEVWWSDTLASESDWQLIALTAGTRFNFESSRYQAKFFRVRARDTQTGLVSAWATTTKTNK